MTIDTNLLVPMAEANQNFSRVVHLVDEHGMAVILKNNKPRYVVVDFSEYESIRSGMQLRQEMSGAADEQTQKNTETSFPAEDPLLMQAAKLAAASGKISTSILQRHLSIGYGRAARILDQMEARGYIGPANARTPREVFLQPENAEDINQSQ